MMLEDLFAVSFLDLLIGSLVAVLGETENGVVILVLLNQLVGTWIPETFIHQDRIEYLPIFRIPLKKKRRFRLADLAGIVVLDVLYVLGSLDTIIFGKGTGVSLLFKSIRYQIRRILMR